MIAHVLLPLPVDHGFDFLVPAALAAEIAVGRRVKVRFTGRDRTGIVAAVAAESAHPGELEPVLAVYPAPAFSPAALEFALEVARDYLAPPGVAVNRILPHRVAAQPRERHFCLAVDLTTAVAALERMTRAPRQAAVMRALLAATTPLSPGQLRAALGDVGRPLARLVELGLVKECGHDRPPSSPAHPLPPEHETQAAWVDALPRSGTALVYARRRYAGYARILRERLTPASGALVLAPEILAATALHRFLARYTPGPIALYHSGLPDGVRGRVWEEVRAKKVQIVVGTRSALFLPFSRLELIIVDDEQDRSYKQDEMLPYYHACTVAENRGTDGLVILGTAAPAVETFQRASQGDIALVRTDNASAVNVRIVDMKGEPSPVSTPLRDALARTLAANGKAIVMVPRRGYFQAVICKQCGRPLRCPHCGVNLAYDVNRAQLVCRVCGRAYSRFACPHCGSRALRFVGAGVERVRDEIVHAFPDARTLLVNGELIARYPDLDLEHAVADADVIVGTPMIAKGGPIPGLRLAAAIGVDALLAVPDFRAAERAYQHLIGLAGRMEDGELIIQTNYPDHYALRSVATGNYELLRENELAAREAFSYPPFARLARIFLTARSPTRRRVDADRISAALAEFGVELLGPSPHPRRAATDFILVKAKDATVLPTACRAARDTGARVEIDIDPDRI